MGLRLDEQELILSDCGATVAMVESDLAESLPELYERLPQLKNIIKVVRRDEDHEIERINRHAPRIHNLADLLREAGSTPHQNYRGRTKTRRHSFFTPQGVLANRKALYILSGTSFTPTILSAEKCLN